MTTDTQPLSPRLKRLAKDFVVEGDQFRLPIEKLKAWEAELSNVPPAERAACAEQLVALAVRFQREGGDRMEMAIGQLSYFAAALLGEKPQPPRQGWGSKPR